MYALTLGNQQGGKHCALILTVVLYEGWKKSRRKALPGWGLEVFVKDVDKGRRGGGVE